VGDNTITLLLEHRPFRRDGQAAPRPDTWLRRRGGRDEVES
jgi:hypothetical protein